MYLIFLHLTFFVLTLENTINVIKMKVNIPLDSHKRGNKKKNRLVKLVSKELIILRKVNVILQWLYLYESIWMQTFNPGKRFIQNASYLLFPKAFFPCFSRKLMVAIKFTRDAQLSVLTNLENLLGQKFPSPSSTKKEVDTVSW